MVRIRDLTPKSDISHSDVLRLLIRLFFKKKICSAECSTYQYIVYFVNILMVKLLCLLLLSIVYCFNPQDCLRQQGSFAQHVFLPVKPAAPNSPDSVSEAHFEHHCHGRAQHRHGARIFHRGTNDSDHY